MSPHRVVTRTPEEGLAFPSTAGAPWPSPWQESSGPTSSLSGALQGAPRARAPASISIRPLGDLPTVAFRAAARRRDAPWRPDQCADNDPFSPRRPLLSDTAPSLPPGKPISHSGRQNPAAPRIVLPSAPPLSLVLITLSRLTASRAAGQTPHSPPPPGPASQ